MEKMTYDPKLFQVQDVIKQIIDLKITSDELDKIAKHVLENECPFKFTINLSIDVAKPEPEESFDISKLDDFDMSDPGQFLKFIHNASDNMDKKQVKKESINLYLDNISNKTFLAVLEKLIKDVNENINNKSNQIKTQIK